MKCHNCGYEKEGNFAFCPQCGTSQNNNPQSEPAPTPTPTPTGAPAPTPEAPKYYTAEQHNANAGAASDYILTTLKDGLFLALCILFSVSTVFTVFSGSFSVINILITVFLWLTYTQAQKGVASKVHIRCLSGTVFASYVVNYVIAGVLAFLGLMIILFGASSSALLTQALQYAYEEAGLGYSDLIAGYIGAAAVFIGFILIIAAVAVAVINYFATHSIHLFVQSVYKSIGEEKSYLAKVSTAKTWLMVFGILEAISAVSCLADGSFIAFIATGSAAAAEIIGSVLIKKYYLNNN